MHDTNDGILSKQIFCVALRFYLTKVGSTNSHLLLKYFLLCHTDLWVWQEQSQIPGDMDRINVSIMMITNLIDLTTLATSSSCV